VIVKDVFRMYAQYIQEDEEGCWIWTGALKGPEKDTPYLTYKGSPRSALRYGLECAGVEYRGDQVMVCGKKSCVHPDHAADTYSVVGRMIKVRESSRPDGDCEIWEGYYDGPHPRISCKFGDAEKMSLIHVKKFVWIAEHVPEGWEWPTTGEYTTEDTCGNDRCVSHKHVQRKATEGDDYDFA
jgi:hypothetical protein